MSNWSSIASSARKLLQQKGLPVLAAWDGLSFQGIKSDAKRDMAASPDGFFGSYEFSFRVDASVFDASGLPEVRDRMTVGGAVYRILDRTLDPVGATVLFHLGELTA